MEKELISIIVPVYNTEDYLERCIKSIINQDYRTLEIILVDDGSSDNSGKICDDFALKDERIKVIHRENGGQSAARNSGLKIATGDYISFVDSDDSIDSDFISFLLNLIHENNADLAICSTRHIDWKYIKDSTENTNSTDLFIAEGENITKNILLSFNGFSGSASHMLVKTIFCKNEFFLEGVIYEDMQYMVRLSFNLNKAVTSKAQKYSYYFRPGNTACLPTEYKKQSLDRVTEELKKIIINHKHEEYLPYLENRYINNGIGFILRNIRKSEKKLFKQIRQDILKNRIDKNLQSKSTYILYISLKIGKNCFLITNFIYSCFLKLKNHNNNK